MAPANGQATDPLMAKLRSEPYAFEFFAAVRLLQSHAAGSPRIGHSRSPREDPVRFAQTPALDFAPSALERFEQPDDPAKPPVLYARHFGLFGPAGPLPLGLTEFARQRLLHNGDSTFADFCDVFHHRLTSFFFRAWAGAQKTVDFDRPQDEQWTRYIGALAGLGMDSLRDRDEVPDAAKFFFAGRLSSQARNAEGLEAILQDYFGVPVELQSFVGRWIDLPPDARCKLGASRLTGTLGATAIAGSQTWTCQHHFRLRIGPVSLKDFQRMLPGGQAFRRLRDWVRLYCGRAFSWDVQLVLARLEVPAAQLGQTGRLGWNAWLKTEPFSSDTEIVFTGAT